MAVKKEENVGPLPLNLQASGMQTVRDMEVNATTHQKQQCYDLGAWSELCIHPVGDVAHADYRCLCMHQQNNLLHATSQ